MPVAKRDPANPVVFFDITIGGEPGGWRLTVDGWNHVRRRLLWALLKRRGMHPAACVPAR